MYNVITHYSEHFGKIEFNPRGVPLTLQQAENLHRLCNDVLEPSRSHTEDGKVHISDEGGIRTYAEQSELYEADKARNGGVPSGLVAHPDHAQHVLGNAGDCLMSREAIPKFVNYLKTNPAVGGIGIYSWGVHVDRRPRNGGPIARWGIPEWW